MNTPEEWWHLVDGKREVAFHFKDNRDHAVEAWNACGSGAEFALKAVILKRERFNRWPESSERPDLYTHNLRRLMGLAQITPADIPGPIRPAFKTVLSWDVEHRYKSDRMPRRQARQMYEATFGEQGVLKWLKTL